MNPHPTKFERDGLPTAVLDTREAAAYPAVAQATIGCVRATRRSVKIGAGRDGPAATAVAEGKPGLAE